jgi:hypothetical protein
VVRIATLSTLLRSTSSLLCKLMSTYGKLVAGKYLRKVLTPILQQVMALPETLELDLKRFANQSDLKAQLVQLTAFTTQMQQLAQQLATTIFESLPDLPLYARTEEWRGALDG